MKKLLLGLFLGILLTKASYTTYSYSWWKADGSPECMSVKTDDGPDEGLDPIFQCIYRKMGYIKYLGYFNTNLDYTYRKWQWQWRN